jgi:hypothetical protein
LRCIYPALIVTDGDFDFGNFYHSASTLAGVITPLFNISIGTSLEEGEAGHFSRRIYEFSPPGWDRQDPFGQDVEGYCRKLKAPEGRCTGGAGKFLTAISTEMIPLLAAKFPIDTTQLAAYAKTHKDLAVGIYFGAGVLEASDPMLEGEAEIVSGMSHLAGVLATRQYPGLKMTIEYHPGMGHTDVMGTSVVRGLRSLYAK